MKNAGQNRTGKCPTCNRRFYRPKTKVWKPGIGAVRKCDRVGYTAGDVRMALYQCKYAQWKQQEGICGVCSEPMDPKYAVWVCAKWSDGTGLAKWAAGRELIFNECTDEFDATPRSPDEIREEYNAGLNGHYLWHRRCRKKFCKVSTGIPMRGSAHVREYEKLVARGIPSHEATYQADVVLREQSRARMEEARSHKASKRRTWTSEERAENHESKRRKRPASAPDCPYTQSEFDKLRLNTPAAPCQPVPAGENLRAAREEAESREPTALERACYEGTPEERLARLASAFGS
jgi:hypothetical protein